MSSPVLRRYYNHECTHCGRPLDRQPIVLLMNEQMALRVLQGSIPREEVWCRSCSQREFALAKRRGFPDVGTACGGIEGYQQYIRALNEWVLEQMEELGVD